MKSINWSKYNNGLIRRGQVFFWFDEKIIDQWYSKETPGGRFSDTYSDIAINALLTLKYFYSLTFREVKGFSESLLELLEVDLDVPCYTTLSRRQKRLSNKILDTLNLNQSVHIVIDSTGLKVYGEGEWKVRKHGIGKRRTWRKLHLAVDESNNQIVAAEVTGNDTGDCEVFEDLANAVNSDQLEQITGDGAYDTKDCYRWSLENGIKGVFPPRKGAKIEQHGNFKGPPLPRDEAIRGVRDMGMTEWKKKNNYHRRSISEAAMYRFKVKFTDKLSSRDFKAQVNECLIKCNILNNLPTPRT